MDLNHIPFVKEMLLVRRKGRITKALSKVKTSENMNVIDVGCGSTGRSFEDFIPSSWNITGIDVKDPTAIKHTHKNFKYIQQNASDLSQFENEQFDLAVSIGLLEHITEKEKFKKATLEIRRVAKQHIVIVPYKYPLMEPHYGLPLFPIYPDSVKRSLVKVFNLSSQSEAVRNDSDFIKKYCIWPSNKDYQKEFPKSKICLTPTLEQITIIQSL